MIVLGSLSCVPLRGPGRGSPVPSGGPVVEPEHDAARPQVGASDLAEARDGAHRGEQPTAARADTRGRLNPAYAGVLWQWRFEVAVSSRIGSASGSAD